MMFSLLLLEHLEWLLGLAAAAFGAILMHRRHKAIHFVEVSSKTTKVEKEILLKSNDFFDDSNPAVFDEWEYESCVKAGACRDRVDKSMDPLLKSRVLDCGQSTAAEGARRKNQSEDWDAVSEFGTEFRGRDSSWLDVARSVLKPGPTIVSKGPLYLAKAKNEVVKLWETSSRKLLTTWSLPDHCDFISALDVDEQWGEVASASGDGYLSLWDIASGGCVRTWQQLNSNVSVVKMSPHYRSLISMGLEEDDSTPVVQVWDRRELRKPVQELMLPKSSSCFETRIGTVEDQLYVRESDGVREYDLRRLAKVMEERKVGESWTLSDEQLREEEEWWDAVDVQQGECWEDDEGGDDEGDHVGGNSKPHHGMFITLTGFLTSLIHS